MCNTKERYFYIEYKKDIPKTIEDDTCQASLTLQSLMTHAFLEKGTTRSQTT